MSDRGKRRFTAAGRAYRIIAFAPNTWHGPWMNRQQLLSRLARRAPVLYSNGTWFSWQRADPAWKRAKLLGGFECDDGVWLDRPPRLLMRWQRLPIWDRAMISLQGRRLRRFSKGPGPLIGYVFHPMFAEDLESISPDVRVYHAYDLLQSTPGWNDQLAARQRSLIERSDLVIASSEAIAAALRAESERDILVLPNGADVASFVSAADSTEPAPEDIAAIPHPRIGYVGNLNRKVDFPLIQRIAAAHSSWQFVFVGSFGNLDNTTAAAVERCKALSNVHFLGGKAHTRLPRYVGAIDVALMCYRLGPDLWTEGIYPLKLHEYLAAGKPVVSADIPSVRAFSEVVAVARSPEEWVEHLVEALDGRGAGTIQSRRAVARQNDWNERVATLERHLQTAIEEASKH